MQFGAFGMGKLRISTIIPAYNRQALIGETLRTILSQSYPPHEIIVVDDGSTDGTPDVVSSFGNDVKLIRQANGGAGSARNNGFVWSTGDIIHFMDSDDLCTLDTYQYAIPAFEQGADMVYGPWLKARFDGSTLWPEPVVLQQWPVPYRDLDVLALLVDWVILLQACFFTRELIEKAGAFRHDLKSEDTELLYRLARAACAPVHIREMLLLYRLHSAGISQGDPEGAIRDRANLWAILQEHAVQRTDLKMDFHRRFRRKMYEVALEVRPYDEDKAAALSKDIGLFDRSTATARLLAHKVVNRLRWIALHDPYPKPMASGPLRREQADNILNLGYVLQGIP